MTDAEPSPSPSPSTDPPPTSNRIGMIAAAVFLAFWITYLLVASPSAPSLDAIDVNAQGKPADYNWTLQDLEGRPVKFTEFAGKAVFLNVWATWCPPCIGEMPSIARLAGDPSFEGKNVAFVCVATDDSIDTVRQFVKDKKWPMTVLQADRLPGVFLTEGIPATFFIAPDGRVVSSTVGGHDWDSPETIKGLQELAALPPKPPAPASIP